MVVWLVMNCSKCGKHCGFGYTLIGDVRDFHCSDCFIKSKKEKYNKK